MVIGEREAPRASETDTEVRAFHDSAAPPDVFAFAAPSGYGDVAHSALSAIAPASYRVRPARRRIDVVGFDTEHGRS